MPSEFSFNQDAFNDGSAAFMRGVTLDVLLKQIDRDTKDPNANRDGSDEDYARWASEQEQRKLIGRGLVLGYINGFISAIRRIDTQMMLPPQ